MDRLRTTNFFLLIITLLALGAILKLAQSVFIPLLIAFLLTYVMDPLMVVLRRAFPVWLSTVITALVFLGVLGGFGILVLVNLVQLGRDFPAYQDAVLSLVRSVEDSVQTIVGAELNIDLRSELQAISIPSVVLSTARGTLSTGLFMLVVYLFAVLFLAGKYYFPRKLVRAFPRTTSGDPSMVPVILRHVDTSLRRFIAVKTLISLTVGTGTGVIASLFGVAFPVIWGLLTFILNFIPTIGSIIATFTLFLFAMAQFGSLVPAIWILLTVGMLQMITGTLLDPILTGDALNLSLLVVFVSLLFWGWLWGPAGVLLAVPMTASVKVILENIPTTARIATLLERSRRR